jgi:signal transduction histidine kinase
VPIPAKGSGLIGLQDRVEALGGTIQVLSASGTGTSIRVELPITSDGPSLGPSPSVL